MRTITALEVRAKFGQVIDEAAAGERFIVERAGVPVAAIVPLEDLRSLDPAVIAARRSAALDDLIRAGRRHRARYGPTDPVVLVRAERDLGHRP